MSAHARTFARPDAAERLAKSLQRWGQGRRAMRAAQVHEPQEDEA